MILVIEKYFFEDLETIFGKMVLKDLDQILKNVRMEKLNKECGTGFGVNE